MFPIITQLQLPRAAAIATAPGAPAERPSGRRGMWALWAGREGWHEPPGSLCHTLPRFSHPRDREGLCLAQGRLAWPRRGSRDTQILLSGPKGYRRQVSGGLGCPGSQC
jgi:hypothetical protein